VQGKEAVLPSIADLSCDQASFEISGSRATIGTSLNHLCYYLDLFNVESRGEEEKRDWDGSWILQQFDQAAWQHVQSRVRSEYEKAFQWYKTQAESDAGLVSDEIAESVIANIAHAAFHLGAIRVLIPMVQSH